MVPSAGGVDVDGVDGDDDDAHEDGDYDDDGVCSQCGRDDGNPSSWKRPPTRIPPPPSLSVSASTFSSSQERERVALVPRPVLHFQQLALRGQTPDEWLSWLVALCGIERRQRLVPCPKPKPAACLCLSAEAWLGTSPSRQLASPTLTRRLLVHARRVRFKHSLSFVVD